MKRPASGFFVAFAAGLLSFLSPCVLPLVPSYVGLPHRHDTAGDGAAAAASRCCTPSVRPRVLAHLRPARRERHRARARRSSTTRSGCSGSAACSSSRSGSTASACSSSNALQQERGVQLEREAGGLPRARCWSGWRSRRDGRRASGRSSAPSWAWRRRRATWGRACCCWRLLGGARGAVPARGPGRRDHSSTGSSASGSTCHGSCGSAASC